MQGNQLSGPIPVELGRLSALEVLQIRSNQLTGPIPDEIGNLTGLRSFTLSNNQLTGDMTAAMTGLRSGNPSLSLDVADSTPTNCLSVTNDDLADWVRERDRDWEQSG